MKAKLFWLETLLGNIGVAVWCLFQIDTKGLIEVYYWTRVHIEYKGHPISYGKFSVRRVLLDLTGLIVISVPFYLILL